MTQRDFRNRQADYDLYPANAKEFLEWIASGVRNIKLGPTTYNIGSEILSPTIGNGGHLHIKGAGKNLTKITGSGLNILDAQDGALTSGVIQMEDLQITHTAPAAGIGLDFTNTVPILKNVLITNNHGTRTDKIGIVTSPIDNSPHPLFERVDSVNYGKGFWNNQDHLLMLNCISSQNSQYGFGQDHGMHCLNLNPHVYVTNGDDLTVGYFHDTLGMANSLINPYFEPHHATHTGAMISNNAANSILRVVNPMIWAAAPNFANIPLSNDYLYTEFIQTRRSRSVAAENKRTWNFGNSTGGVGQVTVPHGLCTTPNYVNVHSYDEIVTVVARESAAADATNIYVTAGNGENFRWYAAVF